MRILFLAPYPRGESPSQRYRFEHYFGFLTARSISFDYKPFLDEKTWRIFFLPGHTFRKVAGLFMGFLRRAALLFTVWKYDFVFIHREAAPLGPPVFEWIICKIFRKRIIYDYDDAIWIPVASASNKIALKIKWFSKVAAICKWSYKVSAGNDFLAGFARRYNHNVYVVPTVVDTVNVHNRVQAQDTRRPAIGWTGTFSTLKYLDIVVPVLQELQQTFDFSFIVIANKDPQLPLKNYQYITWQKSTEADDLLKMHIGLMPLYNNDLEKGKCGFKAIQYMALGIPAVVSPVGVNTVIVEHGHDGYLCDTPEQWKEALSALLRDADLRTTMGQNARKKIVDHYSVTATQELFLDLFR